MPRITAITILSGDSSHAALLTPSPDGDGVWVAIKRTVPPARLHGVWFLRGPLHVVRDRVHDVVYPLTRDHVTLAWDPELRRVVRRSNNLLSE